MLRMILLIHLLFACCFCSSFIEEPLDGRYALAKEFIITKEKHYTCVDGNESQISTNLNSNQYYVSSNLSSWDPIGFERFSKFDLFKDEDSIAVWDSTLVLIEKYDKPLKSNQLMLQLNKGKHGEYKYAIWFSPIHDNIMLAKVLTYNPRMEELGEPWGDFSHYALEFKNSKIINWDRSCGNF